MNNRNLYYDYLLRANGRLLAVDTLAEQELWADVVRESQEVVELALKGLLRFLNIDVPRVHDVSSVLESNREQLPEDIKATLTELVDISQDLRRDRELAFYGSEDVTPSEFYKKKHATAARSKAGKVVAICVKAIGGL